MSDRSALRVEQFEPSRAAAWKQFLGASANGTLYHDLDFLGYHPAGRFRDCHLMFYRGEQLVGLLPGGLVDEAPSGVVLHSPCGASLGGLVLPPGTGAREALDLVECLFEYARAAAIEGLEMRIGPGVCQRESSDLLSFALMTSGFRLTKRSLQFIVPLDPTRPPLDLFSRSKRYDVRSNKKKGLCSHQCGADRLADFCRLLQETYAQLGTTPTHTADELREIFRRAPDRVRIYVCEAGGEIVAAVLLFLLNDAVASTFYICESDAHRRLCGPAVLLADLMEALAAEGYRYLDLGPSASESHFNEGVVFFKEGLGARGFCRDTWRWQRSWSDAIEGRQ